MKKLKDQLINETERSKFRYKKHHKMQEVKLYDLPLYAILDNISGLFGILIGGSYKYNDTAKRKAAEKLLKSMGYKIETSFDDLIESYSLSQRKEFEAGSCGYCVMNGDKSAHMCSMELGLIQVIDHTTEIN